MHLQHQYIVSGVKVTFRQICICLTDVVVFCWLSFPYSDNRQLNRDKLILSPNYISVFLVIHTLFYIWGNVQIVNQRKSILNNSNELFLPADFMNKLNY